MPILYPGEKITTVNAARPYSNFEVFESAVLRNFSSGTGLSPQQVTQDWSDVNYSSARSSLLEAWKTLTRRRDDFSMGTAQPILTAFVEEVHDNEDLPLPSGAPDFVEAAPRIPARAGWGLGAAGWIRLQRKKAPFLVWMRTFHPEIEVGENVGEDWEEVLDQRQLEIESCLKRGLPFQLGAG
jgi:capsid protein